MIWKIYKEKLFYHIFCKIEKYSELFSGGNENVFGKLKNQNPETMKIGKSCTLKANGYTHKTKIKEEKTWRSY